MTNAIETFWVIDDGRSTETLMRDARRFPTMSAACAERRPYQGLWKLTVRRALYENPNPSYASTFAMSDAY